ncbi:electron transfer flavoprotein subunit beta, partial [Streptomyces sp. NPDC059564]
MSLRIVVCVKYVPDATGDRHFADDLTVDRDDVDGLLTAGSWWAGRNPVRVLGSSWDS